jgi:hypothetical protein
MILADNNYEGFSTPQLNIFQERKQFQIFKDYLIDPRLNNYERVRIAGPFT